MSRAEEFLGLVRYWCSEEAGLSPARFLETVGSFCRNSLEVAAALGFFGQEGSNKVAAINGRLSSVPFAPVSGVKPFRSDNLDLLPISPLLARVFLTEQFVGPFLGSLESLTPLV
jgi:hypothetical protein